MKFSPKIYVFDFDGVVCESTDECLVSAWNAWEAWQSGDRFRKKISEFTELEKNRFQSVRPRVRGAGEYYILQRAFSENIEIKDQRFYELLGREWREHLEPFKAVLLEMRERVRLKDRSYWINLHPVYDEVLDFMRELHSRDLLYLATLKDRTSVAAILESQGIRIPEERLLDQSQISTKLDALDIYAARLKRPKRDFIFIDDNVTHLLAPKRAGYSVMLAAWGSGSEEYRSIAVENGIPILDSWREIPRHK